MLTSTGADETVTANNTKGNNDPNIFSDNPVAMYIATKTADTFSCVCKQELYQPSGYHSCFYTELYECYHHFVDALALVM